MIKDLTPSERAFLTSYFRSIFDGDPEFADADEETFVTELSSTDFTEAEESVHGRLVNVAKVLLAKGLLGEVHTEPAEKSGHLLTVVFNETTARTIYGLVQETKRAGTFHGLSGLTSPAVKM